MKTTDFNRFSISMPLRVALDCSLPGRDATICVNAAMRDQAIRAQLDALPVDAVRAELREYGAWDASELKDPEANLTRILWIAACSIREENAA